MLDAGALPIPVEALEQIIRQDEAERMYWRNCLAGNRQAGFMPLGRKNHRFVTSVATR